MGKPYDNPPIIEAVCEFRFEPQEAWDLAVPGLIFEKLRDRFPKRRPGRTFETIVQPSPKGLQQQLTQRDFLQFLTEDEKMLVEVGQHTLRVVHFRPYSSWATFLPVIHEALSAYKNVVTPSGYARVGLRYVNQIDIPGTHIELESYFDVYPYVGERLPQNFYSFILGTESPYEDGTNILRLQITTGSFNRKDIIPIMLDLDHFLGKTGQLAFGEETAWLNKAHDRIEMVFEGSIKDPIRELFGKRKDKNGSNKT